MKLLVVSLCTQGVMRELYIYYCRHFAKYNDLYCITNDNITNEELNATETLNLSYNRKNPFGYFSYPKLRKFKKFVDKVSPDIIYIFTHHATSLLIPRIIKSYPVIYKVHDPVPHYGVGKLNGWIISKQLSVYSKFAAKLVVAGEALKKQVLELSDAKEENVAVIPFGVTDNYIIDDAEPVDKNVDVFFYGRLEKYKGLDTLIDAIKKLDFKPDVYIAGSGDIYKIHPDIGDIPDNVKMLGFLDDRTLVSYIKAAKIIVFPYKEASGTMTIGQCFYYGKPVIVSDAGVFPEYAQDGGIVFTRENSGELAEVINKALSSEKLLKNMSENARKIYSENFTMEKCEKSYQDLFENIVRERAGNVDDDE